jgi:flagellar hook-associated protein 1 FlgK
MSGILSILNMSTNALFAAQTGVEITSHNLANVDTPGYTRQTPVYETADPVRGRAGLILGRGVSVRNIRSVEDRFLNYQVNTNSFGLGRLDVAARGTDLLQEIVNEAGDNGLAVRMNEFFAAMQDLAAHPEGQAERTAVRGNAASLVNEFHRIAAGVADVRKAMNAEVEDCTKEVNRLAAQIADLNAKITAIESTGQSAVDYRAGRTAAMKELAQYVDFHSYEDDSGGTTIYLAAGMPLVTGDRYSTLGVSGNAADGGMFRVRFIDPNGSANDVTDQIQGGKIRGALDIRDTDALDMLERIDNLAYSFAQQLNAIHRTGYGTNGSTGNDFFANLGGTREGSASRIELDDSILADVSNIAAAQVDEIGDNRNALAMAALQNDLTMNGGTWTFTDFYGAIVGDVGLAAHQNGISYDHQKAVTDQIVAYRESITGVSIEEEMTNLIKFQQAYQASAKMINAVSGLLDVLMQLE